MTPATKAISPKRLAALIEEACVDAYNESEQESGFFCMMEEHLLVPFTAFVVGEAVEVTGFDLADRGIKAIVKHNKQSPRVHLLDLDFGDKPPKGIEWVEAYRRWADGVG